MQDRTCKSYCGKILLPCKYGYNCKNKPKCSYFHIKDNLNICSVCSKPNQINMNIIKPENTSQNVFEMINTLKEEIDRLKIDNKKQKNHIDYLTICNNKLFELLEEQNEHNIKRTETIMITVNDIAKVGNNKLNKVIKTLKDSGFY